MQQHDASTQFEIGTDNDLEATRDAEFRYQDELHGLGPPFTLDMVCRLATYQFDLFVQVRGSTIVGEREKHFWGRIAPSDTVNTNIRTSALSELYKSNVDVVSVAKLEIGLGWNKSVECGELHCHVGIVSQAWSKAIDLSEISNLVHD